LEQIKLFYFTFLERFKSEIKSSDWRGTCMEKKATTGIVYECVRCGAKVPVEELELRGGGVKCIVCGYRVLKKIRPPVVKRVSSR
jgi:DNA-directed RNA polymerase subunit RPC12/RpoP